MRKKLYAKTGLTVGAFLILAVPSQAHSGGAGVRSGLYAGLSAGISSLSGSQNYNGENTVDPVAQNNANQHRISAQSAGLGLFAGYGHRLQCTWLAAEVSYLFDRLQSTETVNVPGFQGNQLFKARSTGALGLSFHLGYIPNENTIVYAILGLESRRFQVSFQDQTTPNNLSFANISKKYNSIAFVPGAGARINLAKNLSLKVEYKIALHRSKSFTASALNTNPNFFGGTDTSALKTSPRVQTFHIGVVYSF